ncbi:MAG: 2'-5' RNA ligase family protein [Lachnospiraceae bacterium]|nr:2'-5' RNA ligase family protein [Lachnospiraceae bacterium]
MYLISAYFDERTNQSINRYIRQIAEKTGNTFMTDNHVPPHLTISSVEARQGEIVLPYLENLQEQLSGGTIEIVSVGMFFPYVMYLTPVLNSFLLGLSQQIYDVVCNIPEVKVSRFYQPLQWLPHITLGKTLTKEQMSLAFKVMQDGFAPVTGHITRLGLAKTNPHEDLRMWELKI